MRSTRCFEKAMIDGGIDCLMVSSDCDTLIHKTYLHLASSSPFFNWSSERDASSSRSFCLSSRDMVEAAFSRAVSSSIVLGEVGRTNSPEGGNDKRG